MLYKTINRLTRNTVDSFYDIIILECIKDVKETEKDSRREAVRNKLAEIRDWSQERIYKLAKNVALGTSTNKKSLDKSLDTLLRYIREAQEEEGEPRGTLKIDVFTRQVLDTVAGELWRRAELFDMEGLDNKDIQRNMDVVDELIEKGIQAVIRRSCRENEDAVGGDSDIDDYSDSGDSFVSDESSGSESGGSDSGSEQSDSGSEQSDSGSEQSDSGSEQSDSEESSSEEEEPEPPRRSKPRSGGSTTRSKARYHRGR